MIIILQHKTVAVCILNLEVNMRWFKATRCTGEKGGIGEFNVEDSQGVEWAVQIIEIEEENV